jgi:hypothetical protein
VLHELVEKLSITCGKSQGQNFGHVLRVRSSAGHVLQAAYTSCTVGVKGRSWGPPWYASRMSRTPSSRRVSPTSCGDPVTGGSVVQSLLFDRDLWTEKEARAWALKHGFVAPFVDMKPNTIRIRQVDPAACEYRTKPFGSSGIQAVLETPVPRVRALMDREMAKAAARR